MENRLQITIILSHLAIPEDNKHYWVLTKFIWIQLNIRVDLVNNAMFQIWWNQLLKEELHIQ